jgi:thiol:disulfide interchange protein DsbD
MTSRFSVRSRWCALKTVLTLEWRRALRFAPAIVATLLLATAARAQNRADSQLFLRVDGDDVKAAIEITLDPGYHIGHGPTSAELGGPGAAGLATTLKWEAPGFEWTPARFPEPEREKQVFGETETWVNIHWGTPILWVRGRRTDPAADPATIRLTLRGQTCDATGCVPYRQVLTDAGRGTDALFARFPVDLLPPGQAPAADAPAESAPSAAPSAAPPAAFTAEVHALAEFFVRAEGDEVRAAVRIAIEPGYHLGHGPGDSDVGGKDAVGAPTRVRIEGEGFEWGAPRFPEPEREPQEFGALKTWLNVHHGTIVVWLRGRRVDPAADPAALKLSIDGQTCNASGCLPWNPPLLAAQARGAAELFAAFPADWPTEPGKSDLGGEAGGGALHADAGPQADPPSASAAIQKLTLGAFLWTAFAWGLFSLLMPCTYPMIPITISYFTKQASARQTSILPLSLTYGAGIVLIYVLIGVAVGPVILKFATHWLTNLIIGGCFVVFSLSLFGLILLQPPQFLLQAAGKATRKGGYAGVFLMGATLVITSFTCTAPFVGSLLAAGASGDQADMVRVVLGMTVFGLTMAIPFVFLSLLPGKAKTLPKSGEWMHTLKVCLGFVELAAAIKFISNADLVLRWGVISRELFYLWWSGLFIACALYLWGVIRLHDDSEPVLLEPGMPVRLHPSVGSGRMVAGIGFLIFALYNLHGALGHKLDWVMESLVPPYQNERIAGSGGGDDGHGSAGAPRGHRIVFDDFDAAVAAALGEEKLLLVNFTGFT